MSELYKYSDDPRLPCGYCVGWRNVDPDDINSDAYPIRADGTRIRRLYRRIHPRCQQMVDAYMAEVREQGLDV